MEIGSLRAMYQASSPSKSGSGVEGYLVSKKYVDVNKLKE